MAAFWVQGCNVNGFKWMVRMWRRVGKYLLPGFAALVEDQVVTDIVAPSKTCAVHIRNREIRRSITKASNPTTCFMSYKRTIVEVNPSAGTIEVDCGDGMTVVNRAGTDSCGERHLHQNTDSDSLFPLMIVWQSLAYVVPRFTDESDGTTEVENRKDMTGVPGSDNRDRKDMHGGPGQVTPPTPLSLPPNQFQSTPKKTLSILPPKHFSKDSAVDARQN